jgi:hypothetical protein
MIGTREASIYATTPLWIEENKKSHERVVPILKNGMLIPTQRDSGLVRALA